MTILAGRRSALQTFSLGLAAGAVGLGTGRCAAAAQAPAALTPPGAGALTTLMARLAKAPRRRAFTTVPMILNDPAQWDHEALAELQAYPSAHKQAWNVTEIGGPWLNLMRNALNTQIWSFRHPDFLVVAACHGSAQLALYDDLMWDKYQLTRMAGEKFKTNTLLLSRPAEAADPTNYEDPSGVFSAEDATIPALMRRGAVFLACHNAIWEQSAKLVKDGINPDHLSHAALAAELSNHLIDGAVLTPGIVATLSELQQAGFHSIQ